MLVPGPQDSHLPVVECTGELLQELIQGAAQAYHACHPSTWKVRARGLWQVPG